MVPVTRCWRPSMGFKLAATAETKRALDRFRRFNNYRERVEKRVHFFDYHADNEIHFLRRLIGDQQRIIDGLERAVTIRIEPSKETGMDVDAYSREEFERDQMGQTGTNNARRLFPELEPKPDPIVVVDLTLEENP